MQPHLSYASELVSAYSKGAHSCALLPGPLDREGTMARSAVIGVTRCPPHLRSSDLTSSAMPPNLL